jgi:hypothetical protein
MKINENKWKSMKKNYTLAAKDPKQQDSKDHWSGG